MFQQIQSLFENVRHLLLNPPLAPGGTPSENIIAPTVFISETTTTNTTTNNDPFLVRYLPLLLLLSLFWPVLLTLVAASISASAWLFWLFVGGAFGILQLLFVLYNFIMIFWDVGVLTILKTFAMLRSIMRYYTYKMTDAAGIPIKGSSTRGSRGKNGKLRRRKEWREEVDRAKTFKEYCQIEIFEPASTTNNSGLDQSAVKSGSVKSKFARRTVSTDGADVIGGSSSFGMRKRNMTSIFSMQQQQSPPPSSPTKSVMSYTASSPSSPIRRSKSCVVMNGTPNSGARKRLVSSTRTRTSRKSPFQRNYSSNSLPNTPSGDEEDNGIYNENGENNDCPEWQRIVEDDLGMSGNMLLTTLSRLREARLQASSISSVTNVTSGDNNDEDDNSTTSISSEDEGNDHNISNNSDSKNDIWRRSPQKSKTGSDDDHSSSLKFLLSGIVKRNHLSLDDVLINDARSVAERGQHTLRKETRDAIDEYGQEVERCMEWVASGPVANVNNSSDLSSLHQKNQSPSKISRPNNNASMTPKEFMQKQQDELTKRLTLVKRMKQNMGRTALMLSGGGAQAMYHLGTIKALVESELYEHIHVISGTSGGSITAAMCAIKSPEELLRDVCVPTVSTDYMLTGEMKEKNIRWFPRLVDMGAYWLKHRILADSAEFRRCCEFYYKDITFEEAFEMTGKHVCITVSASRASSGSGVQRLLLNHISTPHVTLASAVAASCALPGFMKPAKLMIKDSRGNQVPFEVDGVEWIDGSVQADLPFKRISTLFNISNYVVAQTNFHVLPFLNKAHHPNINTLYWKMFQMCMWDVRSRVLNLSQLGLFPRIFGQDVTKVFKQKYYGNLTLVPRFTTMQLFGLKSLVNPTVADMENYLQNGQIAAWPFLNVLKEMIRIERAVDSCLMKLEHRVQTVASGIELTFTNTHDEVDSISTAFSTAQRAHLPGLGREAELLKEKVRDLEVENADLRKTVFHLQRALGISHPNHPALDSTRDLVKSLEGQLIAPPVVEDASAEEDGEEKKVV